MPNLNFLAWAVPKISRGSQNSRKWFTWPLEDLFWPNFADFGFCSLFSEILMRLPSSMRIPSMTNIWLFYDLADLAAKMLIQVNFQEFWGILTPKLWNYCFDPQRCALPADTCYEILRVKFTSLICSLVQI